MIYIFKTSVSSKDDILYLEPLIKKRLSFSTWNFDLSDCDRIFRIDTNKEQKETIIQLMKENGYDCEELID